MIFADAGPFVARYLTNDQHHRDAVDHWKQVEQSGRPVYTSSHVLAEAFTLIGRLYSACIFAQIAAAISCVPTAVGSLRSGFMS